MSSLVLELQREAMNHQSRVSHILRHAVVVATKLRIEDFRKWAEMELHGYGSADSIPTYRCVQGELKAHNPYNGWIPVFFEDPEIMEKLTNRQISQAIGQLESLYYSPDKGGTLHVPLPHKWLLKLFGNSPEFHRGMVPTLLVGRVVIFGIIEAVRNVVLKWSLDLEHQGVLGEGMTFSQEEVKKASGVTYNIGSFTGVLGDVSSSQIQVGDYNSIHAKLKGLGISQEDRNELEKILDELKVASGERRKSLVKRGLEWLMRNGAALGALSDTIRGWLEVGISKSA